MTNYYTHYCFALPESGNPDRQSWARRYAKKMGAVLEAHFEITIDEVHGIIVSSMNESINVDEAAQFAKAYLGQYNLDETIFIDYANTASRNILNGFGGGTIFVSKYDFIYSPRFDPNVPQKIYTLIETRAGLLENVQVFATRDKRDKAYFASVRNSQPNFEEMSDEQLEAAYENYDAGDEAEHHRDDLEIIR
jgi:hypothetical protein